MTAIRFHERQTRVEVLRATWQRYLTDLTKVRRDRKANLSPVILPCL